MAGDRRLELAREVRELRGPEVAPGDLLDGGSRVDDLLGRDPGQWAGDDHPGNVAARLLGGQPDVLEASPDLRDVLDAHPVQLNVLPVGDVGRIPRVRRGDVGDGPKLRGRELTAVDADPQHEVLVLELVRLQDRCAAAVDTRLALGVEAPPSEAGAQVGWVYGGEAAYRVDVLDPGAHMERVIVLLDLLGGVERLAVAEGPLSLASYGGCGCAGHSVPLMEDAAETVGRARWLGQDRRRALRAPGRLRGRGLRRHTHHGAGTTEVDMTTQLQLHPMTVRGSHARTIAPIRPPPRPVPRCGPRPSEIYPRGGPPTPESSGGGEQTFFAGDQGRSSHRGDRGEKCHRDQRDVLDQHEGHQ